MNFSHGNMLPVFINALNNDFNLDNTDMQCKMFCNNLVSDLLSLYFASKMKSILYCKNCANENYFQDHFKNIMSCNESRSIISYFHSLL